MSESTAEFIARQHAERAAAGLPPITIDIDTLRVIAAVVANARRRGDAA